jgi:hypothetical protein
VYKRQVVKNALGGKSTIRNVAIGITATPVPAAELAKLGIVQTPEIQVGELVNAAVSDVGKLAVRVEDAKTNMAKLASDAAQQAGNAATNVAKTIKLTAEHAKAAIEANTKRLWDGLGKADLNTPANNQQTITEVSSESMRKLLIGGFAAAIATAVAFLLFIWRRDAKDVKSPEALEEQRKAPKTSGVLPYANLFAEKSLRKPPIASPFQLASEAPRHNVFVFSVPPTAPESDADLDSPTYWSKIASDKAQLNQLVSPFTLVDPAPQDAAPQCAKAARRPITIGPPRAAVAALNDREQAIIMLCNGNPCLLYTSPSPRDH